MEIVLILTPATIVTCALFTLFTLHLTYIKIQNRIEIEPSFFYLFSSKVINAEPLSLNGNI